MARKNAFLDRQRKLEDAIFNAGLRCGIQYNNDIYHIILNDPDIMGKDVFGAGRLEKIHNAAQALSDYYEPVLDSRDPECDVFRDHMDRRLRKIWKDRLVPFEKRMDGAGAHAKSGSARYRFHFAWDHESRGRKADAVDAGNDGRCIY